MLTIQFEYGQQDRVSDCFGPFPFIQTTYGSVRVGENGDRFIAEYVNGLWITEDSQQWSDFIITTA